MDLVSGEDIAAAVRRIAGQVVSTPLLDCPRLSGELGLRVRLKAENLQRTGSFKVRGAANALFARRERGEPLAGVTTFSAGNAAAATAYAAEQLGIRCVVCMPVGAVASKVDNTRRYGGEVVLTDDLVSTCHQIAEERGYLVLHPFDDPEVIAGQGTVGAEIAEDCTGDSPDLVVVPVGGGGLISGVAAALAALSPGTRVVGVEPAGANAMTYAMSAGPLVPLPQRPASLADGLAAPFAGEHTLAHVQQLVERIVVLPEDAIAPAWWRLMDASKLLVEPSAAVGLAALERGLVEVAPGTHVVLVLSGGNTSPSHLAALG